MVVKPSGSSGSEGVVVAGCAAAVRRAREALEAAGHEVVVQEFIEGPSLSLEVIAMGGDILALVPTTLEFDAQYDCMRVVAPAEADPRAIAALEDAGRRAAAHMGLHGS